MVKNKLASHRVNLTATLKPLPERTSAARSKITEPERRILAHEQILQALIGHMAETEPKFLVRLADIFCVPPDMTLHEHDYTDTASYAEQFIHRLRRRARPIWLFQAYPRRNPKKRQVLAWPIPPGARRRQSLQ